MPRSRPTTWTHQTVHDQQRGNGDVCILDTDYWVTGGLIGVGWTLLRTVVSGWFSMGVIWDPAGASPFADAVDATSFEFGVWLNTASSTISPPPPMTDTSTDQNLVWRSNALLQSSVYLPNWDAGNAAMLGRWVLPQGRASESFARRVTAGPDFGEVYFEWNLFNRYVADNTVWQNGYSPSGSTLWSFMLACSITVDQLWEEAGS